MTDANLKASIFITNGLKTSSLTVTPLLYLSNGVSYTLPAVTLAATGTAVVDINQALAAQGLAPYATLSGYVELQYNWPWDAICAMVRSVDTVHSVIFNYSPQSAIETSVLSPGAATASAQQKMEGLWWKQESNVTAFVALANPYPQPVNATVTVSDNNGNSIGQHAVTVSANGTKVVTLTEIQSAASSTGGIEVDYSGPNNGLLISGGLEDSTVGYSANIPFLPPPAPAAQGSTLSYAELGLMTGAADPMLNFPVGTVFTPFSVVRNISSQPATVTPTLYWMANGTAQSAASAPLTVAAGQSVQLDVLGLMSQAGLKNFNGSVSLTLDASTSAAGALLLASGSVDAKNTYVFQVRPQVTRNSDAKTASYWSTGAGDDTMITLWNPADEAQDLVFTLFFTGGQYLFPVHLGPRATQMFNVSEITKSGIPDSAGTVIPASIQAGAAEISGTQGEAQEILVAMDASVYNVQKATCNMICVTCDGYVYFEIAANPFSVNYGDTNQLDFTGEFSTGSHYFFNDFTSGAGWTTSDSTVATVSAGLVTTVAPGNVTISASADADLYYYGCAYELISCPQSTGGQGSTPGTVQGPYAVAVVGTIAQGAADCSAFGSNYSGWSRLVTAQLQTQAGTPIKVAGITMADIISIQSPNALGIAGTITGSYSTNSLGQWPDLYFVCSTTCPGTAGAIQNWTWNGLGLFHTNQVQYSCSSITVDGN